MTRCHGSTIVPYLLYPEWMVTIDEIQEFPSFKNISPFLYRVNLPLLPMTCEGNKFVMVSSFIIVVVTSKIFRVTHISWE